jgi:hypothetical protein
VCERINVNPACRPLLDPVIAHRGGGSQRFVDIALLQHLTLACGVRPDTGVAIGLQLETYGQLVRVRGIRLLRLTDSRVGTKKVLNMMSQLVREYVRLSEIAGSRVPLFQLVEESEVQVDSFIDGAIKRAHR